jgi:RNA-dependent RNA polymerase
LSRIFWNEFLALEQLRPPKNISAASKAFAIVQFETQESASLVENAAQRKELRRGSFFLKVRPAERDIIPRPRVPMFCLEDADLHFGCLVKENVLCSLESKGSCSQVWI